jgi:hypothetical protein
LKLEESFDGFSVFRSTRSWTALFFWPFLFFWAGTALRFIYWDQLSAGHVDWLMALLGLTFVACAGLLLYLAFMASFGRVELALARDGMLRLRKGGLGLYSTRTVSWADVLSAELWVDAQPEDNGVSVRYACVIRLRQGDEWRFATGDSREQAVWLAGYLSGQVGLRQDRA